MATGTAASFLHPSVRPLQQAAISSRPQLKALFIGRNGTSWPGHDGLGCCIVLPEMGERAGVQSFESRCSGSGWSVAGLAPL